MITLSQTSKLDGIKSWSLQAVETCPGALRGPFSLLVPACEGCYAREGNYHLPNVIKTRKANKEDWQRKDWVKDMVAALDDSRYFRWFDSGDMYTLELAYKILSVMSKTPQCKHWLPTRMHKFPKFASVLKQMEMKPNVVVRRSSDSIRGEFTPGVHGSTIIPNKNFPVPGVHVCTAYNTGGKCSGCRRCWDKETPVVAYVSHGARMLRLQREHEKVQANA